MHFGTSDFEYEMVNNTRYIEEDTKYFLTLDRIASTHLPPVCLQMVTGALVSILETKDRPPM